MKAKLLFVMAAVGLMSLLLVGCSKKDNASELSGTKWKGSIEHIQIEMSFVDNECYLTTNIPGAAAKGTYTADDSKVYITISNVTGDWGGNLSNGTVIAGTYNKSEKTLAFQFVVDGYPTTIRFHQV